MPKKTKLTTLEYIQRAQCVHGGTYDYVKTAYTGSHDRVIITCPNHGEFSQRAYSHLQGKGCNKCGIARTKVDFIRKAQLVHGDTYDYTLVHYQRNQDKVVIVCKKHGEFQQSPQSHLRGHGCMKCANETKQAEGIYCESYFDSHPSQEGKLYILEMWSNKERFIKIGITKTKISERYGSRLPYAHNVIFEKDMDLEEAFQKEQMGLREFNHMKYQPTHYFKGHTESLMIDAKDIIDGKLRLL